MTESNYYEAKAKMELIDLINKKIYNINKLLKSEDLMMTIDNTMRGRDRYEFTATSNEAVKNILEAFLKLLNEQLEKVKKELELL